MDYAAAYDTIIQIRDELIATIRNEPDAAEDYRTIQALAAAYTLQDYTAERIAEQGEPPEGAELDADT